MNTFGHIDYNAKIDFDVEGINARLKTAEFQKRWLEILKSTDELLQSSRKVDSHKLNDRFGS